MSIINKKRYVAIVVTCVVIAFTAPTQSVHAGAWGEALMATGIKQTMEVVTREINNVLTSTLKTVAISAVMRQVNQAIGQKGTFITSWEDYLFAAPKAAGIVYANDLITRMTLGRASAYYDSKGESAAAGALTHEDRIASAANSALQSLGKEKTVSLSNYVQGPMGTVNPDTGKLNVFNPGSDNFAGYAALVFNPMNSSPMAAEYIEDQANQKAEQIRVSRTEKQKGAGYATPDNVSPSALRALRDKVNAIPISRALASNDTSEVAAAMAQQFMTSSLEGAERSITKRVHMVENSVKQSINANGRYKVY